MRLGHVEVHVISAVAHTRFDMQMFMMGALKILQAMHILQALTSHIP